jgi:hypothetical protein
MTVPLEKDIETAVKQYARDKGCLAYKFTSPARSAVPDAMFVAPGGKVWFCEFKRKGLKPTPAQLREHMRLRGHGVSVWVIDSIPDGKEMVDRMVGDLC